MKTLKKACAGFISRLPTLLFITTAMLLILVSLIVILGELAFSPYVQSMALNILSVKELSQYLLILAIYGFTLEFFLRKIIQENLLTSRAKWAGILAFILPVLLYTFIHSRYGAVGTAYGAVTGIFLTAFYLKKRDWLAFSLWHMLWGPLIIGLSMATCVFVDSQTRNDFLFCYKKKHIMKEKMYLQQNWGWVDTVHYRPDHFTHLMEAVQLASDQGTVELTDGWVTPLKIPVKFSVLYHFKKPLSEVDQWAMVTGMMMYFMELSETTQAQSPWYHGNQLSAWQFDDMSSCLLCCLDHYPGEKLVVGDLVKAPDELLNIWQEVGEQTVSIKMTAEESWALFKNPRQQDLRALVAAQKKNWSATVTSDPLPSNRQ